MEQLRKKINFIDEDPRRLCSEPLGDEMNTKITSEAIKI